MTFTLDSSSDTGRLRVLIFDIDSTDYIFEDAEIEGILEINSSDIWASAADLCRSLAAKYAAEAQITGLGKEDIYLDKKVKAKYYLQMAAQYSSRSGLEVSEYIDSYNFGQDGMGNDETEYIGDI